MALAAALSAALALCRTTCMAPFNTDVAPCITFFLRLVVARIVFGTKAVYFRIPRFTVFLVIY